MNNAEPGRSNNREIYTNTKTRVLSSGFCIGRLPCYELEPYQEGASSLVQSSRPTAADEPYQQLLEPCLCTVHAYVYNLVMTNTPSSQDDFEIKPWRLISTSMALAERWFPVRKDEVELPSGKIVN